MRVIIIKVILYLCAYLPLPLLHALGTCIGWGLILTKNRSRHNSEINIALCFPELTPADQGRLVRRSLLETGKTIMETGALWLRSGKHTLRLIREVEGGELVERARLHGKGIILATPHLGAWEGAGLYCACKYNITCLYRPLKIPGLEQLVNRARSRLGGNFVPANTRGIRTLYQTLDRAGAIAMLPDQEPQQGTGMFAPFFGIPAYSMVFLGRLAAKSDAPVIFTWCERLPLGRGYRLHFRLPPARIRSDDLAEAVSATNQAVENCVRECPAQYQWSYRRFRTRPDGEKSLYKN
ncbi:MAG TPA: lysophospholipid acyltransferase family protein [Gammaproteobacteria bacterium]|nr:lysophospholipid acyltransferase family protein [Gammaproteobacteria bacterium]